MINRYKIKRYSFTVENVKQFQMKRINDNPENSKNSFFFYSSGSFAVTYERTAFSFMAVLVLFLFSR